VPQLQVSPAGQGDDKVTFQAELRALRDRAALDYDELAARAHFPTDVLKEAESGPDLPGLPILMAYVRACGSDAMEWEERWRRLASAADNDSGLPVRPAGASQAAVAGARASVTVVPAEAHDSERIKAALRAHREREDQVGRLGLAHAEADGPMQAAVGQGAMLANGNHHKVPRSDMFDSSMAASPAQAQTHAQARATAADERFRTSAPTSHADGAAVTSSAPARESRIEPNVPASAVSTSAANASVFDASASGASAADVSGRRSQTRQAVVTEGRTRSSHSGLLALLVVLVLIGCVALLALT
jgi:hypothetical protein